MGADRHYRSPWDYLRRTADIFLAAGALLAVSPVVLLAMVAIFIEDRGPIFFRQDRIGYGGKPFTVWKLRSMRVNRLSVADVGQVKGDHHLVTRVGRVIRRWKIDELPQLLNVIRGDMSLVGPRPTVASQVAQYDDFQRRRLTVRPGMTGWAQVNGGVELTWEDRILLDVWYVDHRSLLLDGKILFRTIQVVLAGERPNTDAVEIAKAYANSSGRGGR